MSSIPPLSVTVTGRRCSCVLDTTLALSPYGLLITQRLGEEFDLWLCREFWQILDNTEYYAANPELLMFRKKGGREYVLSFRRIFDQWESARIASDLAGLKLYWLGDAMFESLLPAGMDQNIVHRFETLALALEERRDNGEIDDRSTETAENCFRDAAALTAALMPSKGFILTRQERRGRKSTGEEPAICGYLRERLGCNPAEVKGKNPFLDGYLMPILARCGISELLWAGASLAAVHLVAPQAAFIPVPEKDDGLLSGELDSGVRRNEEWWSGAECFWYSI
jgi:hypothetical protein